MPNKTILILFLSIIMGLGACTDDGIKFPQAKVSDLQETEILIQRYGKTLFSLDTDDFQNELKNIQDEYRFFLAADLNDPVNVSQLYNYVTDTQLISIYHKTMEVYPDMTSVEDKLGKAFGRYAKLFNDKYHPQMYSYISDMYYELPVWTSDSVLIIALDVYLGKDFPLYTYLGLPLYRVRSMEPGFLVPDVMRAIYNSRIAPEYKRNTLLDRMIDEGKALVFLDAVLPDVHDSIKIRYTASQLNWANENEKETWAFLVGNQLLYSTDYQMQSKLMQDGPFTTGFGNNSPPRLGAFIGWKIVIEYLRKNPEISLQQMINNTDSQGILQTSGYKP
jgi:hypothetical protein